MPTKFTREHLGFLAPWFVRKDQIFVIENQLIFVISFRWGKKYGDALLTVPLMLFWPVTSSLLYIVWIATEKDKSDRKEGKKTWLALNAFECWFEALPQVCET